MIKRDKNMSKSRDEIRLEKIRKITEYLENNPEKRDVKNTFIERFILCEILCKEAMLDYWHDNGKKLDKTDTEGINLWPDVIKNAIGPDTYHDFSEEFLLQIFGGKDNKNNPYRIKGNYSAKMLRDKITHELLITAIDELYNRRDEINELMEKFMDGFDIAENE